MRSIPFFSALLACACVAVPGPEGAVGSDDPGTSLKRPPNIVLFLVDDLGWRDLGCTGSRFYETPRIDALAAAGLRSTAGYAACAVCSPSRAAVQTGRYPVRTGITDWIRPARWGGPVTPDGRSPGGWEKAGNRALEVPRNATALSLTETSLAEHLHAAGYASAHIGKWHLGGESFAPQDQGYALNAGGCDLGQPPDYFDPFMGKRAGSGLPGLAPKQTGQYLTDREAEEACQFMRTHRDRPFFLHLASYAVHTPIQAPPDLVNKYSVKLLDGTEVQRVRATYAGMVESVDRAVGQVLDALTDLGLSNDTLVVFTSDNGGHGSITDNRPLRGAKGWPYEGGLRVPLIVRWPGRVPAGSTSHVPFSSIDLVPTLLDAAGLPSVPDLDGLDFIPHWLGDGAPTSRALFWHYPHYHGSGSKPHSVVRDGPWKLIRWYERGRDELFHLENDPGEATDLSATAAAQAQRLGRLLDAHLAETGALIPRRPPAATR